MARGNKVVRRVRWRVVRRNDGQWTPIVLLGEEPVRFSPCEDRGAARRVARARAQTFKEAGA
jgi:hypothetical protein